MKYFYLQIASESPLAGDINWMETSILLKLDNCLAMSPLAGDINWMETSNYYS